MTFCTTRWFRFRTSSLLWLMVAVAAFFCGQRSDEISRQANKWWQVTRVWFGATANPKHRVVMWPQGSATINEQFPIQRIWIDNSKICSATMTSPRQLRVSPMSDGEAVVSYAGIGTQKPRRFEVVVENGQIVDWTLEGP
jgi:hypothetical protein